jgi:RNA polymerase sigma factor (sigma-70 family)
MAATLCDRSPAQEAVAVLSARHAIAEAGTSSGSPVLSVADPQDDRDAATMQASELLHRLEDHDREAWHSVVQDYAPRLRRLGFSYRLGAQEVEDALQATWLILLTHLEQLRDAECLGAWLSSIMRHECLRVLRLAGRRRENLVEDWAGYEGDLPEDDLDVDAAIDREGLTSQVWRLVRQLPPRQRDLIRALYEGDQPSYSDVSVRLAMPVGAIGPTRQRALRRLRELIEDLDRVAA